MNINNVANRILFIVVQIKGETKEYTLSDTICVVQVNTSGDFFLFFL